MRIFFIMLFCLPILSLGDNYLFQEDLSSTIVATKDPTKTLGLQVNSIAYDKILRDAPELIYLEMPFFNKRLSFQLEKFKNYSNNLRIVSKNKDNEVNLDFSPTIISYKLIYKGNSIGVMNFYNGLINATFKVNGKQFEITRHFDQYLLFEASNSINNSSFSCEVKEQLNNMNNPPLFNYSALPVCIEFGVDVDYYTRQTFNTDLEATNWALAIFAGVSQLYEAQTNASITVEYLYIWNTTDPYAAYVNDAGNMLDALGAYWQNNNSGISRDLVHLLTKRNNTGTGGIAWLDGLCSTSYGYGFSSALDNNTTYNFPNPTYTWNLNVVAHEIGHNVGSSHTHDCVWSSDPNYGFTGPGIDDCGPTAGYGTDCGPTPPYGTIMSYCHVTSTGVVLEFHNIVVSQALDPGIASANCLTVCNYDGCTDPNAFNYDPSALNDDGSCCYVSGCTDPNALNYNSNACYNDGSCSYPVYGCTDPNATNYDASATTDDGSCCYGADSWLTLNMYDTYGDGWNGNEWSAISTTNGTIYGPFTLFSGSSGNLSFCLPDDCYDIICDYGSWDSEVSWTITDISGNILLSGGAPYNSQDDFGTGSCNSAIYGCTDPNATNYDVNANTDDGSCIYCIYGCIDPTAFNYDANATCDNGSCIPFIYGCIDSTAFNYDSNANTDDGSCIIVVYGCTDPTASNYDANANTDDGSCILPLLVSANIVDIVCYGDTGFIDITVSGGIPPYYYYWTSGETTEDIYTLGGGTYTFIVADAIAQTSMSTYTINSPSELSATYTVSNVSTSGGSDGSIDLSPFGGTPPYLYYWSNGANTEDIYNLSVGTYTLYLVDANNCYTGIDIDVVEDVGSSTCSGDLITGLYVSDIIDDRCVLNFDNMNTYDANGNQICRVDQIRIKYREVGTTSWSQKNIGSPTGYNNGVCNSTQKTDKNLYGLTLGTTYEWEVKLWYCDGQTTGWAPGPNFTTAAECPNVGNTNAYGSTPTRATFTWDASNGSYEFVRIKIRVDSIQNPTLSDFIQVGGAGVPYGTFTKNKNGLISGETYRGQGRTWCDPNGGAYNSLGWTSFGVWSQPTNRIDGGQSIKDLDIYPNPSRDVFNISFTSEDMQDLRLRVLNVVGEELIVEDLQQFIGEYTKQITLGDNAKGVYFLEIETNEGVINKKLILQ